MKKIITLICGIGFFSASFGQKSSLENLQNSQVNQSDFQIIAAPATLADEVLINTQHPGVSIVERAGATAGLLSPMAIPVNDNCVNAILLTVNAACVTGTNKEGTIQAGENSACQGAITKSVWYRFVATGAIMYVEVERTVSSGCFLSSAVYSGGCLPTTSVSCEDAAGGPNLNIHNLTGLTVGNTYYVQVSYTGGAFCGNNSNAATGADFCIKVGRPVNCNTCATPCGPMCVFASTPTVAQVTSTCTRYDLFSRLNTGQVRTQCYTFTAVAASFSLQMIINTVGCSGGNVTTFDWQLYPGTCAAVVQSGNLGNLNATGLTTGNSYVLCYTWTAACQHNSVYPYIVATAPLPINLIYFDGNSSDNNIELKWVTASEINNKIFYVERSGDGINFNKIGHLAGKGNSNNATQYSFIDQKPLPGINYYRLVQIDFDDSSTVTNPIAIKFNANFVFAIGKNPVTDFLTLTIDSDQNSEIKLTIFNQYGKEVYSQIKRLTTGLQEHLIPVEILSNGVYQLNVQGAGKSNWIKFIKM